MMSVYVCMWVVYTVVKMAIPINIVNPSMTVDSKYLNGDDMMSNDVLHNIVLKYSLMLPCI